MQRTTTINWESQQVFSQIAEGISKPLSEIIRLHKYLIAEKGMSAQSTQEISSIILESSQQIQDLIADIVEIEKSKKVEVFLNDKFRFPELYIINYDQTQQPFSLFKTRDSTPTNRISQADLDWLKRIEQTIINHLDFHGLNISWLSKKCATSERHLFRKVEKFTGLTPNKYIRNLRLLRAKELLEQYACSPIAEVSASVGIKDPYYFSKLFEQEFGIKVKSYF